MKRIFTISAVFLLVPSAWGKIEYNEFTIPFNTGLGAYFGSNHQLCNVRTADEARNLIESGEENAELIRVSCDSNGSLTPLDRAATRGFLDVVKYFVEDLGADVNLIQSLEVPRSTLWEALLNGQFEVAQYLVSQGADTQILEVFVDRNKETILKEFLLKTTDAGKMKIFLEFCEANTSLITKLSRAYVGVRTLLDRGRHWILDAVRNAEDPLDDVPNWEG